MRIIGQTERKDTVLIRSASLPACLLQSTSAQAASPQQCSLITREPFTATPSSEVQAVPLLLKSQEYSGDLYAQHNIELLDDNQYRPDRELIPYIYSDSRVGTPRKYSSGIRISGSPGKTEFHGAVIPTRSGCIRNKIALRETKRCIPSPPCLRSANPK
jgi:hypothetical protein